MLTMWYFSRERIEINQIATLFFGGCWGSAPDPEVFIRHEGTLDIPLIYNRLGGIQRLPRPAIPGVELSSVARFNFADQ